ncbi:MAG TPA: MerR family transcriptional regulator [Candidatus Limiplasma stercoravium]|nr:MerR family transcriptional regulator [Candidatus Limiplasma stercoravium]
MYTIGQVAQRFQLPISTIRYYDREGLFPNLERKAGIRQFSEADLETLRVIECLKKAGLEMKDIRQFMQWCVQGASTYPQRYELFIRQRANVEAQMKRMQRVLDMIRYKCWYYETAIREGTEEGLKNLSPAQMPREIRQAYESAHQEE